MAETLLAVQEIGGREELIDLLALYEREEGWMKERIREAFTRLKNKARVTDDDRVFDHLDDVGKAGLAEILAPKPRSGRARRSAGMAPRPNGKTPHAGTV